MWVVEEAAGGIPAATVDELSRITHLKREFLAGIINLSTKTLDRYKMQKKRLSPAGSELMLKLFALYRKGEDLFGNTEEFGRWIDAPAFGLNYKVPRDLLITSTGIDLVMEELTRIEFGDLA